MATREDWRTSVPWPGGENPHLDRLFGVLTHPYRRRVLVALGEADPERGGTVGPDDVRVDGEDRDRLATALYHTHFPRLETEGYVRWDRHTNTVRRGPNYGEIASSGLLVTDRLDDRLWR